LNTTARKNDKIADKFSPYMSHMTYFVLKADLANQIGNFDEKKALAEAMQIHASKELKTEADLKTVESRPMTAESQTTKKYDTII
jgi:hypothetical protein